MTARNPTVKPTITDEDLLAGKEILAAPLDQVLDYQEYIFSREKCDFLAASYLGPGTTVSPTVFTEILNTNYVGHDRCDSDTLTAGAVSCDVFVLGLIESGFSHSWDIKVTSSLANSTYSTVATDFTDGIWYGPITLNFLSGGDSIKVEVKYTGSLAINGGEFFGVALFSNRHTY